MSKLTFKIMLANSADKNGRYRVKLRVTFQRKPSVLTTQFTASKEDIIIKNKKPELRRGTYLSKQIDDYLQELITATNGIEIREIEGKTSKEILQFIESKKNTITPVPTFHLDFQEYAENIASTKKEATARSYRNALKSFSTFIGKEHYDISVITSSTLKKYEKSLIEKYGKYTKTITLYLGHLASIHRSAREEYNNPEIDQILIKNPFEYFRPEAKPISKDVPPASKELIQYIIDEYHTFNNEETRAADVFLLMFALQGINAADMLRAPAPKNNILIFNRSKTKDRSSNKGETQIKIHEEILPIYNKFRDPNNKYAFSFAPKYKINYFHIQASKWMKALRARIKQNPNLKEEANELQYGSARHSYPTISRQIGIDKRLLNDGMSHVDPEMKNTDRYIKIAWEPIWEANKKMLQTFNWQGIQ